MKWTVVGKPQSEDTRKVLTSHAGYLHRVVSNPDALVKEAVEALRGVDCDTFVGTGLSGALVVPMLARAMGKYWLIVRKPSDSSHSCTDCEGALGRRWLFVDDLVDSGETRARVLNAVAKHASRNAFATEHVGQYLYEGIWGESGFTAADHT